MDLRWLIVACLIACCHSAEKFECPPNDALCEQDKIGYDAIQQLHLQIDDDNDGNLDRSESDEFLRDELKYTDGFERHSAFHGHDDAITVNDLWHLWVKSEVYNWTVDDVIDWLSDYVDLPQYIHNFKINAVDGRMLPRIAANTQYLSSILGIKHAVHKQKLVLKAMDTVLFGAPKHVHNWVKDLALVASLLVAVGGCWLAYVQNKYSQSHLKKVMKDLDTLQKAEDSLLDLQKKLETAEKDQIDVIEEKRTLERKYQSEINEAKAEADKLKGVREETAEEVQRLKIAEQELDQVRRALRKAEKELEDRQNAPLAELQQWLQLTYELESRHYDAKKEAVERHLLEAKEMCQRVKKKKSGFLGPLITAHTTSMDNTDKAISSAKAALEEIRVDLQERSHRWQEIEKICGFNIIMNPGQAYLEQLLATGPQQYSGTNSSAMNGRGSAVPLGVDDADEDSPPGYMTAAGVGGNSLTSAAGMEPRVWPNLMNAGMQLTMLGLGLTNTQAMSLVPGHMNYKGPRQSGILPVPGMPSHPAEKRVATSLTQAYSSSSLSSPAGAPKGHTNGSGVHPLTATMQPVQSRTQTVPTAMTNSQCSDVSSESEEASRSHPRVEFSLGDNVSDVSVNKTQGEDIRERTSSFGRSVSDQTRQRPNALTLNTSRSESALSRHLVSGSNSSAVQRLLTTGSSSPTVEEESSPESTETSSITSTDDKSKEKKKKKKLFHKLLGKDKSKVS